MSHNTLRVGSSAPNAQSVISPQLTDLANVVVSSPQANDLLAYDPDTQTWSNLAYTPPSPANTAPLILIGRGEQDDYANSGYTTAVGQRVCFYDSAPINTIEGATLNVTTGTSWVHSVTLPAGKYTITAQTYPVFSSSGVFAYRAQAGATVYSSLAAVGASLASYGGSASCVLGQVESLVQITIYLNIVASSGVAASQGTEMSQNGVLFIRRVS